MINRRTTLLGLAGAGLACVVRGVTAGETAVTSAAPAPVASAEDAIREDLARMGSHEYSDEGIPVFLACVDLTASRADRPAPARSELGRRIAADLRRYGDAWLHLHPDAPVTDVSKVIEVLAERDFARGGPRSGS